MQVNSRYENKLTASSNPPTAPLLSPFPVCLCAATHHLRLTCFVWTVLKNVVAVSTRLNTHTFSSDACKAASFLLQRLKVIEGWDRAWRYSGDSESSMVKSSLTLIIVNEVADSKGSPVLKYWTQSFFLVFVFCTIGLDKQWRGSCCKAYAQAGSANMHRGHLKILLNEKVESILWLSV